MPAPIMTIGIWVGLYPDAVETPLDSNSTVKRPSRRLAQAIPRGYLAEQSGGVLIRTEPLSFERRHSMNLVWVSDSNGVFQD
jgi:hypothetical protein